MIAAEELTVWNVLQAKSIMGVFVVFFRLSLNEYVPLPAFIDHTFFMFVYDLHIQINLFRCQFVVCSCNISLLW